MRGEGPPIGPIKTAARRRPSLIIIIVTGTGRCAGRLSAVSDPPKDHVPVCLAASARFPPPQGPHSLLPALPERSGQQD